MAARGLGKGLDALIPSAVNEKSKNMKQRIKIIKMKISLEKLLLILQK